MRVLKFLFNVFAAVFVLTPIVIVGLLAAIASIGQSANSTLSNGAEIHTVAGPQSVVEAEPLLPSSVVE